LWQPGWISNKPHKTAGAGYFSQSQTNGITEVQEKSRYLETCEEAIKACNKVVIKRI